MKPVLLLVICLKAWLFPFQALCSPIELEVGQSRLFYVPQIQRIAIADAKVVSARASPPDHIYLAAKKEGRTDLTVWHSEKLVKKWTFIVTKAPKKSTPLSSPFEGEGVHVRVEFYEIDEKQSLEWGVEWADSEASSERTQGLNFQIPVLSSKASLKALLASGGAKLLARPELHVKLGEQALFQSGGEFPVVTLQSRLDKSRKTVEWKKYGIELEVTPHCKDGTWIESEIKVDISGLNTSDPFETVPSLNRRKVQTKLVSQSGETIFLSGLVQRSKTTQEEGIAGLMSIPLLGHLFKTQTDREVSSELLLSYQVEFDDHRHSQTLSRQRQRLEQTVGDWRDP